MTGQKNRFKTSEKLWDLDDKQLKTPVHDAMVLWLMDEDNLKALLFNCCDMKSDVFYSDNDFILNKPVDEYVTIKSEVPIKSSPTFIAGYADLIVDFHFNKFLSKEECPISEEWYDKINSVEYVEEMIDLLKEYHNDDSFEASLCKNNITCEEWCVTKEAVDKYISNDIVKKSLKEHYKGNFVPFEEVRYYYEFPEDEILIKHRYCGDELDIFSDFWFNTTTGFKYCNMGYMEWIKLGNKYVREKYNAHCLIEVKPYIDSFGAVLRQIKSYKEFYERHDTIFCLFTFDKRFDKQFESQGIIVLHPWTPKDEMLKMYGLD